MATTNVHTRAGVAFGLGAPLGAAMDVAKSTTSNSQAAAAGRVFATPPANTIEGILAKQKQADANEGKGVYDDPVTLFANRYIADPITAALRAAGKPVEKFGDFFEAETRYKDQDFKKPWYSEFNFSFLDPRWREEWAKTQSSQASIAQTLWLSGAGEFNDSSYDETYALLDDPVYNARQVDKDGDPGRTAREEYFGSGWAKWTTGIGDAAFSIFADPLVVGGKVTSVARASANTIKATDVAAAARGADNLTRGGRRINATVDRVIDASERVRAQSKAGTKGGYADLANSKFLGQTADAGAIPYFMKRIDDEVDDAVRVETKRDVLFAGMGDREALGRLEKKDADLALELESFNGPNRATAIQGLLARKDFSHLENLRAVDEDAFLDKVVASHMDDIKKTRDALARVHNVGSPAGLSGDALQATSGVGELRDLTDLNGRFDFLRVGKTIHRGRGLPPVHVLFGRHIPGSFSLSSDDAFASFNASLQEAERMFGKSEVAQNTFRGMADDFVTAHAATDPAASRASRRAVVDRFNRVMEKNLAHRYGGGDVDREHQIVSLIREVRSRRTAEMAHIQERAYRAKSTDGVGYSQTDDGVLVFDSTDIEKAIGTPVDGSQLQDLVSLPSYKTVERAIKTRLADGAEGFMRRTAAKGWEFTDQGLSAFNDLWKFSALFRIGYPIRTQVDSQARIMATIGVLQYAQYLFQGSRNLLYNAGKVSVSEVETAARRASARLRLEQIVETPEELRTPAMETERLEMERVLSRKVQVVDKDGKAVTDKVRRRGTELARYIGKGEGRGNAFRSTADVARGNEMIDAHASTINLLTEQTRSTLSDLRKSEHVQEVAGSNPLWMSSYLDMVNKHVRNSHPMMSMLAGASDEDIARWYRTDHAGRAQWEALSHRYENPMDLARVQREQLETLLPEGQIRSLAMGGPLSKTQVEDFWGVKTKRPAVPAEMLERVDRNAVVSGYNRTRSQWFKYASEMPETMLARHPFFVARKELHLRHAISNAGGDADALTVAQYNQAAKRADVLAKRDVGEYMFDTSQRSNLGHHLRFLSPFYAAWSDTMRKWARIAGENLAVVPLIPKAFMAPNSAFVVVDNDGNRILQNGDVVDATGKVIRQSTDFTEGSILVGVPEWLTSWTGGSDKVKVSKSSLNVIFQGEPFWLPGPGPLVSIGANKIARDTFPEAMDDSNAGGAVLRYLLPFGVTDDSAVEQTMPMWARNLKTAVSQDTSDDRFAQTYAMLMAEEVNAERRGESPQRSQADLEKLVGTRARNWFILRFMGSEAPFSTQPTGRLDYWRQEWQRYQRTYGGDARDRFYQDYPDYFEASISLSANDSGITATDQSWQEASKYRAQIKANEKFGWMFVGAANLAPGFNPGVYTAEKARGLRSTKDPVAAFDDLQVSKGWHDFQAVAGAVQLKLDERKGAGGSASLTAKSNADLKALRDQFVLELKAENAQWANEYDRGGRGKSALEFLRTAAQAAQDEPKLAQRSDFQALEQYVDFRHVVQGKLAERVANGGAASLDASSNADLRELWDNFTSELIASDLGFEQMFTRGGLDRDDLTGG